VLDEGSVGGERLGLTLQRDGVAIAMAAADGALVDAGELLRPAVDQLGGDLPRGRVDPPALERRRAPAE